ncbi:MAG: MBL fold metallo-hydrolase [Calothrix sp. MO_167.B12]|nr:MBL fold metallo-hydrolase [Calothrix sp. MO_167.B12]
MKIQMIGHASIFVETKDAKFLMDPVLWDPHQEGLFDVCPQREVITEKIPDFDILIISHKHLDHFDIRSLAYLPKNVEVIIPKDRLIERSLRKLGYRKIYPLGDFRELKIGKTNLMTTRSENRVPEFGVVFADESGVFWNCVDTELSTDTIGMVLEHYPTIDFLLATWQPMLESNYHNNESLSFPYYEYGQLLYNINLITPKAISPGANAFKYINGGSWLNQIVFPVTREQFCQDAKQACPELGDNIFALDPGDTVEFNNGKFNYLAGGCEFVKKIVDDRDELDFSPVKVGNGIVDQNPDNYDVELMEKTIEKAISVDLAEFIQENKHSLFREHCRWHVVYQLEVVFPNGSIKWFFDFTKDKIEARKGRSPLANLFTYITASSFYSLLQQTKGWDYVGLGGYHRSFNKIYQVTPFGLLLPHYIAFADPLMSNYADDELEIIMRDVEIKTWGENHRELSPSNSSQNQKNKIEVASKDSERLFTASSWLEQHIS